MPATAMTQTRPETAAAVVSIAAEADLIRVRQALRAAAQQAFEITSDAGAGTRLGWRVPLSERPALT
jgi:hypothetical protein